MQKKNLTRMFAVMALLFVSMVINAQGTLIKGNVISATDKEAVIGATVREQGTQNAVITDLDGNFSIKVSRAGATLEFRYIGFVTLNVAASNGMKVVLHEDVQTLKEVVVTGYMSEKESRPHRFRVSCENERCGRYTHRQRSFQSAESCIGCEHHHRWYSRQHKHIDFSTWEVIVPRRCQLAIVCHRRCDDT